MSTGATLERATDARPRVVSSAGEQAMGRWRPRRSTRILGIGATMILTLAAMGVGLVTAFLLA